MQGTERVSFFEGVRERLQYAVSSLRRKRGEVHPGAGLLKGTRKSGR